MSKPINNQPKEVESVGETSVSNEASVSVFPEQLPQQPIKLALPEIGKTATMTEAELQQQERHRQYIKYLKEELGFTDLEDALTTTIYKDSSVKVPLFCVNVLSSTTEEQVNAILTGESAIGKTHNVTETLWYFKNGDPNNIIEISDASPRSFIHQANAILVDEKTLQPIDMSKKPKQGDQKEAWDNWHSIMRNSAYFLDLSNKILIFLDIPNFKLLESIPTCYLMTAKSTNI